LIIFETLKSIGFPCKFLIYKDFKLKKNCKITIVDNLMAVGNSSHCFKNVFKQALNLTEWRELLNI